MYKCVTLFYKIVVLSFLSVLLEKKQNKGAFALKYAVT